MKNRDNIALLTMACIGTTLVYKCYTEFIRRKRLKDAILKFYRNEDTIKDFLYLYSIENTDEISNYLALSYYKKGIWNEALKYTKSDKVKYKCYIRLERYKDALLCGFSIYFCKNDDKILEKVKNVMKLYVNEQVSKHKVKRVSDIAYREFFETFTLLFNNFTIESKIEDTNKSENTETQNDIDFSSINIVKNKNIRKCVYEKIKYYVENSQIDKLRRYTKHRSDNLSNFVKLAFALIESDMPDTLTKIELNSDYENEQAYEHKIFTYCTLLINFYTQTPAQYSYQDISTMFYELKMNGSDTEELIGKIMRYKSYSFVFHYLLQQNFFLVDEAYKLFPTDPKILSLACEIYISTKEYEKADNTIINLERYCTNDPRTYICMFYKARITNDKDKRYLQKAESLDCYFYRTYLLLANCFKESDSRVFLEYLQKAKECCNNYDALGEIFELEIIEEAKSILNNSLL